MVNKVPDGVIGPQYLRATDLPKGGLKCSIVGTIEVGESRFENRDGTRRLQLQIPIEADKLGARFYTPTSRVVRMFCDEWTDDMDQWIGKSFLALPMLILVGGEQKSTVDVDFFPDKK